MEILGYDYLKYWSCYFFNITASCGQIELKNKKMSEHGFPEKDPRASKYLTKGLLNDMPNVLNDVLNDVPKVLKCSTSLKFWCALHALGALLGKSFGVPCVPFMLKTLVHPKVCRNVAA